MSGGEDRLAEVLAKLAERPYDEGAWQQLYDGLWPSVFARVAHMIGEASFDAEELAQEVFVRLLRRLPYLNLESGRELRAYAAVICRNLVTDRARARRGIESLESPEQHAAPRQEGSVELDDAIQSAVDHLGDEERELFWLWSSGASNRDLADALGVTYSAAAVRVHRMRKKLAGLIEPDLG